MQLMPIHAEYCTSLSSSVPGARRAMSMLKTLYGPILAIRTVPRVPDQTALMPKYQSYESEKT